MDEDFNIDERTELDDLFRDALDGYSEEPSVGLWKKLNSRLNRKETLDFITFRKTPGIQPSEKHTLPLYRQQWARIAVAASIAILLVFVSRIIVKQTSENIIPAPEIAVTGDKIPAVPQNNPDNYSYKNAARDFLYADVEGPGDDADENSGAYYVEIPLMPYKSAEGPALTDDLYYADNNYVKAPDQNRPYKNDRARDLPREENLPVNNVLPDQNPLLADAGFNPNDPIAAINIRQYNDTEAARIYAARVVDSLIRANAITEINEQEANKDVNEKKSGIPENKIENELTPPKAVEVPNVFTPNGDGINDFFLIKNLGHYTNNSLIVFDRNGRTVLQQSEYQNNWDANGVDDGTYFYILTYTDAGGKNMIHKGMVYIKRSR